MSIATDTRADNDFLTDTATIPAGGYITVKNGIFSDVNLYIEDSGGSGRPIVLIHGWPLSGAAWEKQIPALVKAGYRVIDYDRRGFGRSDKPNSGYDYDTFADDLNAIINQLGLTDFTLIGHSMGGGEIARYISKYGEDGIHSVVFASAVPPYLAKSDDNPEGPLSKDQADDMESSLKDDRASFFNDFVDNFFSANGTLTVDQQEFDKTVALAQQSDQKAALDAMEAFGTTDFRDDLTKITVPTLIIHGAADAVVPFEGSGKRTHEAIEGSELVVLDGAPHGAPVANADEWNHAVLDFIAK